jgi:signal transduction histidine kinase
VAPRWRIRHKLLLGLGVVVAIIALLVTGTLLGLAAFTATVKTADSKLAELHALDPLKRAISELRGATESGQGWSDGVDPLALKLAEARKFLAEFEARLKDTIERGRDKDEGGHERNLVRDLYAALTKYEEAVAYAKKPQAVQSPQHFSRLVDDEGVRKADDKLKELCDDVRDCIYVDLYQRFTSARQEQRRSLIVVITTSVLSVLLMASLLRFFYSWVFHPIRDLQEGVQRVAQGDFSQPIVLNSQDEMQELAAAFNDMTTRLHGTYHELSRQVTERGKQLLRSERLASLGYLAAGVAHEINNPLASIAFGAEAVERRVNELLGRFPREHETIAKYLKMIQQEAFRCKQITQGLLEFSRVGEGQRQPTDLAEVVQSVLDMIQHHPQSQGKQIAFRPVGRTMALANPQEIKQVVLNIVVNALDSMDEGGVLTIKLVQNGPAAEIQFADTGCGMAPEVLDKVFEPFFTANRTGKGTGLGLSISQRIVSQHGGEIEAASPGPGRGSRFVVRLPLSPTAGKEVAVGRAAAA